MALNFIVILLVFASMVCIPVLIGVYVYRDASSRGMNAALWTLVAILAPTFIGLIIYLIVRSGYSDLKCPDCAAPVEEQYFVCPKCGARLKAACPDCGFPVEADWSLCPKCSAQLPEQREDYHPPETKKDRALGKIIAAVILIPALFMLLLAVLSFVNYAGSNNASLNMTTNYSVTDYAKRPEVTAWIESCDRKPEGVYALCYKEQNGEAKKTYYLVYTPSIRFDMADVNHSDSLFEKNIEVRIYGGADFAWGEAALVGAVNNSGDFFGLKVFVNDERTDCEITYVDYNPML